jgi:hypothetical protein
VGTGGWDRRCRLLPAHRGFTFATGPSFATVWESAQRSVPAVNHDALPAAGFPVISRLDPIFVSYLGRIPSGGSAAFMG